MATAFTKYLNLKNVNQSSKDLLDAYIEDQQDFTFRQMSQAILEINENESLELLKLLKIQKRALLHSANEEKQMDSSDEDTGFMPSIAELPQTKKQTVINLIKSKDKFINDNNKLKTNLKQHFKLKDIFKIPSQQTTIKSKTRIKIQAITEMQIQYETERLDRIPDNVLIDEFEIRIEIIETKNKVQSALEHTINSLTDEIANKTILTNLMTSTKRNRHTTRNKQFAQYQIQKLLNAANGLNNDINDTKIRIESYALHRNFIVKQNNVFFAQINEKYGTVTDTKVINYFLSMLISLTSHSKKLSDKLIAFRLHIESNSYKNRIGSAQDMKDGHAKHEIKLEEDRKRKSLINNVLILLNNKIAKKYVQKILHKNKYNIISTIGQIHIDKNLSPSTKILKHNNICQSWIMEKKCDDEECVADNKHRIPEKVNKLPKQNKRLAEKKLPSELQPKKKKRRKSQTEFAFQPTEQSQKFHNFFNTPKSSKNKSTIKKKRESFGFSTFNLNINENDNV